MFMVVTVMMLVLVVVMMFMVVVMFMAVMMFVMALMAVLMMLICVIVCMFIHNHELFFCRQRYPPFPATRLQCRQSKNLIVYIFYSREKLETKIIKLR